VFFGFFLPNFATWQQHKNPSATDAKDFSSEKKVPKSPDFVGFFVS